METPERGLASLTVEDRHYTTSKFVRRVNLEIGHDVLIKFHSKADQRRESIVFDVLYNH
jgi:hypothetical protein